LPSVILSNSKENDMAHSKSAKKRIRSAEIRRLRNRVLRKRLNTLTKAVLKAETKEQGETALKPVIAYLDQMANRGIVHKNKAANQKSQLTRRVNNL
jgi:small subunit ribosomal protein S20